MRPTGVSSSVVSLVRFAILLAALHSIHCLAQDTPPPPNAAAVKDAQKKVQALTTAVNTSFYAMDLAKREAAELNSLIDSSSDKGDFLSRVQKINDRLKKIDPKLSDKLATNLITEPKGSLPSCDVATLGTDAFVKECNKSSKDADDLVASLPDALATLQSQFNGVVPYFDASLNALSDEMVEVNKKWSTPGSLSSEDFASGVAAYGRSSAVSQGMTGTTGAKGLKEDTYAALKKLGVDTKSSPDEDTLAKLNTKLSESAGLLDPILTNIKKTADETVTKVSKSITAVATTPIASAQSASDAATEAGQAVRGAATVLNAWPQLEKDIQKCALEKNPQNCAKDAPLAKLRQDIKAIQLAKSTLQEQLSLLNDALVGDPNQFTEDAVPLFFYTEVEKLMRSLNERTDWAGGNSAASTVAASQRELLLDAESRVAQARGEVADLQFELAKLQEEQRKADAATSRLSLFSQQASKNKKDRDSELAHATDDFNQAQKESDADPTNAKKKERLQKASEKRDTAQRKADDATTKQTDADTKVNDANAQQTASNGDKDSLKARIDLATSKLGDAQRNMEEMQRSAYRAALTESDAFAAARDQMPYLEAPALSTSPDPVKRVIMRGYPDRNLILLRGKPADIVVVKRIIDAFDVPAPQARLTLWSFEISAEVSKGFLWFKKPVDRLNEATAIVDKSLSGARQRIAGATNNLRESVNETVSHAETQAPDSTSSCSHLEMPNEFQTELLPSEQARWRRFRFYSPEVLNQAGVNMASAASFKNAVLPDPASTTTVGEALMVLALSCRPNRERVFANFRSTNLKLSPSNKNNQTKSLFEDEKEEEESDHPCFSGTAQVLQVHQSCATELPQPNLEDSAMSNKEKALAVKEAQLENKQRNLDREKNSAVQECGKKLADCEKKSKDSGRDQIVSTEPCPDPDVDPEISEIDLSQPFAPTVSSEGITDTQLEIVHALRAGATKKIVDEMKRLLNLIGTLEQEYRRLKSNSSYPNLPSSDRQTCRLKNAEIKSLYNRYNEIVNRRLGPLYPDRYKKFRMVSGREDFAGGLKIELESLQRPEESRPRVAAADEMLKRMSSRMEDDLDKEYIQPMLKVLRTALVRQGLTVGIVQRTSVLATNRLKARVDPKGMYDLSVGEQQDLLASVGQLTSIYLSAQTGGILSAFGSLNSLNQKQEQRIYGVTTGNKFEVTPIFDPSGQALRFKFDYVSNSMIRNPKGTVDPSMPSIRHTVNTEVQLSNLEIREISRYESNAKLGIPTRYYGGIPILTDIPGLKPIPLIGWFVRRAGSNAEVQQSVIFGQTTIYPTIGSIVDLLQTGN